MHETHIGTWLVVRGRYYYQIHFTNEATEAQRCWGPAQRHAQVEQEADGGICSPGHPWGVGLPPSTHAEGGIFWPEDKRVVVLKTIVVGRERKPGINAFKLKWKGINWLLRGSGVFIFRHGWIQMLRWYHKIHSFPFIHYSFFFN